MLDALTTNWSRPYKIVRVLQALGMDVPKRLRRERLAMLIDALAKNGVEATLADGSALNSADSPGIEAKIRLRLAAGTSTPKTEFDYEVIARIPSGGMAECFKVREADGSIRFLKKVPVGGTQGDALRRELEIYTKLEYANANHVVRVHECKQSGDFIGLLLEFAEGGTLEEYREQQGQVSPEQAKAIALEILAGLRELHALGIVHRDLKPKNVLQSGNQWKLADFGISKNLTRLVSEGRTFQRRGTPGYTPQEQWDGREAHSSADVYAFGKLLVFLLSGDTDVDQLYDFPAWARLVRRCTSPEPNERPTLEQVQEELSRL